MRELFKWWVRERRAIRERRAAGQPWPWTDDPVLRAFRFTNEDRRHDRVTLLMRRMWSLPCRDHVLLWNVIVCRMISRAETLESYRLTPLEHPEQLEAIHHRPCALTRAFTTTRGMVNLMPAWHHHYWAAPEYLARLRRCDARGAYALLVTLSQVGEFMGWQILCDLRLTRLAEGAPWAPVGDWAQLGPGAVAGAKLISPGEPCLKLALSLRDELGTDLEVIEHSLCEFSKYVHLRNGGRVKASTRRYA